MAGCLPPRYRFLDLVFALGGTLAFLGDLGMDVWSAASYYRSGDPAWAALQLTFYGLSSSVLQLLSWGWFRADRLQESAESGRCEENGGGPGCEKLRNGNSGSDRTDASVYSHPKERESAMTAYRQPATEDRQQSAMPANRAHAEEDQQSAMPANRAHAEEDQQSAMPANRAHAEEYRQCQQSAQQEDFCLTYFCTSQLLRRPRCLLALHLLQLGYPLRCLHSLEVGIAAYRNPGSSLYQDYAYFLTHDISMMRLVETFLENTPQLILILYIIIRRETIYIFQYFSIAFSFICISWAILDYHQSLRMFLKDKKKLTFLSSIIYFLWNLCLISARILCVTLFAVAFQWMVALHFVLVWAGFLIWACLQKTDFMKNALMEFFYRAAVAVILYFSCFNIADGRTLYRLIFYHAFIILDSIILLLSWKYYTFPSSLDNYETFLICTFGSLTTIGLLIKLIYYKCFHPNVSGKVKEYFDEPDGRGYDGYKNFAPVLEPWTQNGRMLQLAKQMYW